MKRNFFKILIFLALPLVFSGCGNLGHHNYNDNKSIASENDSYKAVFSNLSPITNGSMHGEIKKIDGFMQILEASVSEDTETALHISITANSGKAKLVLVKPNSEIEILGEAISGKDNKHYEENVSVRCLSGINKIKLVGENYGGNFEISQPREILFQKNSTSKRENKEFSKNDNSSMFDENFPF